MNVIKTNSQGHETSLPLGLPSHLSSPLPFFFYDKKPCRKKSQRSFCKENKCMQGWNPQKPAKQDGNDTTILSKQTRSYILYHFANNEHRKVYCMHISLFIPTKCITIHINNALSTAHSTSFYNIQDASYLHLLLWCHSHLVWLVFKPWFHPSMHLFSLIKLFMAFLIYT